MPDFHECHKQHHPYYQVKLKEDRHILHRFLQSVSNPYDIDPLTIPVSTFGLTALDDLSFFQDVGLDFNRVIGGIARNHVRSVISKTPFFRKRGYRNVDIDAIRSINDIYKILPLMSKDPLLGTGFNEPDSWIAGFRNVLSNDPYQLVPEDLMDRMKMQETFNPAIPKELLLLIPKDGIISTDQKILKFPSGGSLGKPTITILTYLDVLAEAYALARSLIRNGFKPQTRFLSLYKMTHKGGLQLKIAAKIIGMDFYSIEDIRLHANTEKLDLNAITSFMESKRINIIAAVEPPERYITKNEKGNTLSLSNLFQTNKAAFKEIDHAFLTGFPPPEPVVRELNKAGIIVSTTWGSTEVMAAGTTIYVPRKDFLQESYDVNDLLSTSLPTHIEVLRIKKDIPLKKYNIVHANPGEKGILVVTSLYRAGTQFLCYVIGDLSVKTERGFKGTDRAVANISGSCAADALNI